MDASYGHSGLDPSTSSIGLARTRLAIRLMLGAYGRTKIGGVEQGPLHPGANRGKGLLALQTSDASQLPPARKAVEALVSGW